MKRKKKGHNLLQSNSEESFELDLAPMLALMVCLIPIMLLATALVQVKVVETPLPQVVKEAIEKDKIENDRKPTVELELRPNQEILLSVSILGKKIASEKIESSNGNWDTEKLYQAAVAIKRQYPNVFHVSVLPDDQISYEEIVSIIDSVRRVRTQEESFTVPQNESEGFTTELIFPEVIFSNILEV